MKLKEKIENLKRKFSKITPYKFAYNKVEDLNKSSNGITAYYLLHENLHGYSIMVFQWKRKEKSIKEWRKFLEKESYEIFTTKVLAAINVKYNSNWTFKDLIMWSLKNDIREIDNSDTSKAGDKTKRKRTQRA